MLIFHLLNDYSGSTRALERYLRASIADGKLFADNLPESITLVTSAGGPLDALASIPGISVRHINYRFSPRLLIRSLRWLCAQFSMSRILVANASCHHTVVANTILPSFPLVAARILGKKTALWCHELPTKSRPYRMLCSLCTRVAHRVFFVSEYQRRQIKHNLSKSSLLQPLPDPSLAMITPPSESERRARRHIVMLTSLLPYKGIGTFLDVARLLPDFTFELVANASEVEVASFLSGISNTSIPSNTSITLRPSSLAEVYARASIVLCLTDPRLCVESFGLTVAEAHAAGLPAIVPTVGGPAEQVTDNVNGLHVDVTNPSAIARAIISLS